MPKFDTPGRGKGRPIQRKGPTGKIIWHHPEWEDQRWALAQILPRMIPTLASQELTGDPEKPLIPPLDDREIGRRLALLLYRADKGRIDDEPARVSSPRGAGAAAREGAPATPEAAPAPAAPQLAAEVEPQTGYVNSPESGGGLFV